MPPSLDRATLLAYGRWYAAHLGAFMALLKLAADTINGDHAAAYADMAVVLAGFGLALHPNRQ